MRIRSVGRPIAESRGGGTGERGLGANGNVEGVNENVEGVNRGVGGALNFLTIIAQQLQNLLPTILAQVGNQGNVGNQNGNVVNENIQENVRNVLVNGNRVGCTYKEFLACNPKEYDGKGGAVVLTRWIKKMESVQDMSGCSIDQKVKYTASSFVGKALTWWNSQIRTLSREVAANMEDDVDISALTMEQCIALIPDDIKLGIVNPKIGDDIEFEINENFMRELRCKIFAGTDDEDAYEHVRTVLEIVDLFHFPGVIHDAIMLRKLEKIRNFKQERDETLYHAWERYNDILYQCPLHDLNCQQKVHIFYIGLDISTHKILDSNGFIPLMTRTQALESIQVMADHSHDWYDEPTTRERINDVMDNVDPFTKVSKRTRHSSIEKEHDYDIPLNNNIRQPLTPQMVYITPSGDDYVAPATDPMSNKQLNKFEEEFSNITKDAEKEYDNPVIRHMIVRTLFGNYYTKIQQLRGNYRGRLDSKSCGNLDESATVMA
ncbi:hypothetical protein Tco_0798682 [Tanacetum coccineum]